MPYASRSAVNFADFLDKVDAWLPAESERVYAILDNLSAHRATDVLLFALSHPRWEFVFQPKYAAYLNLIEPWWKTLRSGRLSAKRCAMRPPTGMSIATLSSGVAADAISPAGKVASASCPKSHRLAGCTT